jgi:hypothetical protein
VKTTLLKLCRYALLIPLFIPVALAETNKATGDSLIADAQKECAGMGNGQFDASEQALTLHDVTGDGQPETIVDAAGFSCSTAASLWGGSGGTYLWVIVDGEAHEFLAHGWKVVEMGSQTALLLAVHSSECGDYTGPCYRAYVWHEGFKTTK